MLNSGTFGRWSRIVLIAAAVLTTGLAWSGLAWNNLFLDRALAWFR